MKRFIKIICVVFALILSLGVFTSCTRKPGLYNWLGMRVKVDYALRLVLDVGDGKKEYLVPFDEYYGVFMYYKSLLGDGILEDENKKLLFTTVDEQTKAVKEMTEDDLMEFYALYAIAEKYGVGLTQEDYDSFESGYKANLRKYLEANGKTEGIDNIDSYTDEMYQKLFKSLGTSEDHVRFSYLRNLLSSRVKKHIAPDAVAHAEKYYFHIKQVLVLFTKGDSSSEKAAWEKINAAKAELDAGTSINDVIKKYDSGVSSSEIYFDASSVILGSENTNGSSVSSFVSTTVNGLNIGDTSDILTGDYDEEFGYFCIIKRLGFDESFVYGDTSIGETIFRYYAAGSSQYTPQYSEYKATVGAYTQNLVCYAYNQKIYDKINVKSMK